MGLALDAVSIRRAHVRAQLLGSSGRGRRVEDVVSGVVGAQAQELTAAALSVRARSRDLLIADVHAALAESRSVVWTWSLRGTRHLHHQADARWLLGLLGPVLGRPGRRAHQLGIGGDVGDRAVGLVRDALASEGPLSRSDIKERLAAHGVDPSGQAPIHVIRRAALEGLLCIVPDAGGDERYVLLDDWVGPGPAVDADQAAAELARRYLGSYGPAAPYDFAAWSGLGTRVANSAWRAIGDELVEVDGPRGTSWIVADHRQQILAAAADPAPLRLVGGFDALLLGYADRGLVVPPEHARRVHPGGGVIKPAVLSDGQVIATWSYRRGAQSAAVEVDPFRALTPAEHTGLELETIDVGRFLGSEPTLAVLL